MQAAMPKLKEAPLPNGDKLFCLRKAELPALYREAPDYLTNGIQLREGDVLFDVGANIGVFSLWAHQLCGGNLNVYSFEPIPQIFNALNANAARFGHGSIKAFACGLSNRSGTVTFAFHPNGTTLSTAYPERHAELRETLRSSILRNFKAGIPAIRMLGFLPAFLRNYLLDRELDRSFKTEQVSCQMKTLSQVIRDESVQRIDLLKIDVEKSELEVLMGIEDQDWPKIRQVVMEVHDVDGVLQKIRDLFERHGFDDVSWAQTPIFQASNVYNVYARRTK